MEPDLARLLLRYRDDPLAFVVELLRAEPEPWQENVLRAWPTQPRISIRSGHGVGKSALLSWIVLHHQITKFPAKCGTTAPTEHQLRDVLWAELGTWLRRMPEALIAQFNLTDLRMSMKGAEEESFATGRVARPEKPEAFAGLHSPNMLLVADEASGVPEAVFETGIGALSTPGARMIMMGNPTRPEGFFYKTQTDPELAKRWWIRRVSSEDVERATHHIDDVIAMYGRDSNAYRVRVLGEFPTTADEQVIPTDLVKAAITRPVEPSEAFRVAWGVDVARFGNDRSALCKRRGNVVLEPVKFWRNRDTMQTARLIKAEFEITWRDEKPSEILVDVIGIGAGVVDRLHEFGLPVIAVNVAETPSATDRFARSRDELWWRAREWFAKRDCKVPDDPALLNELTAPTYSFSQSGKIVVESKDDQKRRIGFSPDLADAFILTMAGGLELIEEHAQERNRYAIKRKGARAARGRDSNSWMTR